MRPRQRSLEANDSTEPQSSCAWSATPPATTSNCAAPPEPRRGLRKPCPPTAPPMPISSPEMAIGCHGASRNPPSRVTCWAVFRSPHAEPRMTSGPAPPAVPADGTPRPLDLEDGQLSDVSPCGRSYTRRGGAIKDLGDREGHAPQGRVYRGRAPPESAGENGSSGPLPRADSSMADGSPSRRRI